ncbi:hypothetical protein [Cytobacillus purgationiresistens]|uniref:Uncharacterized protein n=1 Tax=Cytobacillus purgationiresistens TaxID=863449 RepID=A0ABU0ARR9_9BACI|nr:hypothetical protein [Cytobacillus purgationiresistens]MDQ0273559.1 hypothetical protein [Cytobacillus purgationiresistens]
MKRLLVFLTMLLALIIFIDSPTFADSSSIVIGERKAGGFEYTVNKTQDSFHWTIAHKGERSEIEEDKSNSEVLTNFMIAVNNLNTEITTFILSLSYLLIILITVIVVYQKNIEMLKSGGLIILMLGVVTVYVTINTLINAKVSFEEATFYYLVITS